MQGSRCEWVRLKGFGALIASFFNSFRRLGDCLSREALNPKPSTREAGIHAATEAGLDVRKVQTALAVRSMARFRALPSKPDEAFIRAPG